MSTEYFILTKNKEKDVYNNKENQIITVNEKKVYLLPQVNIDYYVKRGLFEANLIDWSKQFCHSNKNIIDIGSHTGTYAISLANHAKHVYAFEPQKMTYYALCGSVALSNLQNVTCYNYGLGSQEQKGEKILNIVSNDGGGSSLQINNQKVLKEEKINIDILDNFNLEDIDFIKIDVEGNEYDVIKGGIETIKKSNYPKILFESNAKNEELNNLLQDLGYTIINVKGCSNMLFAFV
jgi:FkbM family methyltransferase